ncbi:hypothetical protein GCM10010094_85390 [Streptomyces flaveus]|uniref:Uncharacterized protein n=1 Tax=Streptomyces flaveus TaxID=66370 RepID=A0A917RJH8_9ACTN|nr:hypothetical protein GCM10010094_85390 [Streptomyces flaveus]
MQMQLDIRLRGEHRQIRLQRDVAESDAADLHRGLLRGAYAGVSRAVCASAESIRPPWWPPVGEGDPVAVGSYHAEVPSLDEVRELIDGMLGG